MAPTTNKYRLSLRADRDLLALQRYSIEQFGRLRAQEYKNDLHSCFEMLATFPDIGRVAPGSGAGVRRHEHQSHIIFYEHDREIVTILAVVHKRSVKRLKVRR